MDELRRLLHEIQNTYESNLTNDEMYHKVSNLWEKYYALKQKLNIDLEEDKNLCLFFDNSCYKINEKPNLNHPNETQVVDSLTALMEALHSRAGITEAEAKTILEYVVYKTRQNLGFLGLDLTNNSMNGFCELAQRLSIDAFEKLGLKVTKNRAENDFMYSHHHCFGTVTIPLIYNNNILNKTYLVDITYRQFFTSTRCHKGMYYNNQKPDPGYFIENTAFAKELMKEGYIELNPSNAKLYGKPFTLAGNDKKDNIDYYHSIINSKDEYYLNESKMEGLQVDFPTIKITYK